VGALEHIQMIGDSKMPETEKMQDVAGTMSSPGEHAAGPPVTIAFRHMEPSPAVEADVLKHAEALARFHDRIMSCRVIVEAPHRHHRKGGLYRVAIDVRVPHGEIVAKSEAKNDHAHEDVYVAIRDAFSAASRRLQDFARRADGDPIQEARSSSLRQRLGDES
jgi:ribosome-associated translation inhibitor RaiA